MQWHSDGAWGESTILMSLFDFQRDFGVLKVVPGSHYQYVEGIGYDEVIHFPFFVKLSYICLIYKKIVDSKRLELESQAVHYAYEEGNPIVLDARVMHGVENNYSNEWRVVCWFIVDSY
jgi:ectoine hydroxylase-related dioxygenase (phytanoyl-CoA dioxygenase family)